jgi:hypothetical protein
MITQPAPALPQTVYIVFSGQIDPMSVQRLINACTNATDQDVNPTTVFIALPPSAYWHT